MVHPCLQARARCLLAKYDTDLWELLRWIDEKGVGGEWRAEDLNAAGRLSAPLRISVARGHRRAASQHIISTFSMAHAGAALLRRVVEDGILQPFRGARRGHPRLLAAGILPTTFFRYCEVRECWEKPR